jgi:hypothetical protein
MKYIRVQSIQDPLFAELHRLMQRVFPPEEVLEFSLWEGPIADPDIFVCVAVHESRVVGATEFRYDPKLKVAMTDFTIIGEPGLGVGRFLYVQREKDLHKLQQASGTRMIGMFAEIYDPEQVATLPFGRVSEMHPAVRRQVLSHLGYRKLDIDYVHPSWDHEGQAVRGLNLGFRHSDEEAVSLPAELIVRFLRQYYSALPNKPAEWNEMITKLEKLDAVALLPL